MQARKGFMRIIEVSIAAFIVITILLIFSTYRPATPEEDTVTFMAYGYYDYLAQAGILGDLAVTKNTSVLFTEFGRLIPLNYNYAVGWNNYTNAEYSSTPPLNKTIHSFSYIVAGKEDNYAPTVFELFLWE